LKSATRERQLCGFAVVACRRCSDSWSLQRRANRPVCGTQHTMLPSQLNSSHEDSSSFVFRLADGPPSTSAPGPLPAIKLGRPTPRRRRTQRLPFAAISSTYADSSRQLNTQPATTLEPQLPAMARLAVRRPAKASGVVGARSDRPLESLISGAVAAIVSRTAVAPLERVKMDLVLLAGDGRGASQSALTTARHILRTEGLVRKQE
jgi:hypothetical protein